MPFFNSPTRRTGEKIEAELEEEVHLWPSVKRPDADLVQSLMSSTNTLTVLGKRKARSTSTFVLHLHSDPEVSATHSDHDHDHDNDDEGSGTNESERDFERHPSKGNSEPMLINGKLVFDSKRKYACTYEGCDKAYTKPSRLEEHERSHNGEVCQQMPDHHISF